MKFDIWKECPKVPLPSVLLTVVDNRGKTVPTAPSGHKLIATNCVRNENLYPVYEKIRYLSEETYRTWFRAHPEPGDIIFVCKGTPGRVCLVPDPIDFCIAQDMVALRADPKIVYNKYLLAVLRSFQIQEQILSTSVGDVIPHFKKSFFDQIMIPIPNMDIQKSIGDFYYTISEKTELNKKINDNLYDLVNTLYTKLFKDTDCEMTTVEDYVDCIYSGGTPATSNMAYWNGNLNWLSSGETRNRFVISTEKTITQLGADNSSTKSAQKYDIVIASAGQGFTRGQTSMLLLNTYINQSVIVLHAKKTVLPYLFWNLTNRYDDLRAISDSSSIRGSLTTKMLSKLKIPKVEDSLILKFSEFAWSIIPQIENNLIENKRLTDLRDSLLPKLMSGEIDVSDIRL
jgi:type I restriction enzyme S subunit